MSKWLKSVGAGALGAGVSIMCTSALAADSVNLVGTWKGLSNTTVMGADRHHKQDREADEIRFVKTEFTLVIEQQEGQNFYGQVSTEEGEEVILGAFSADMKGGVMVDSDGIVRFEMFGNDKFEHCYAHGPDGSSQNNYVVSCVTFVRQ